MTTIQVHSSEPGKTYTLRLVGSTWQCECVGYQKRQRCRHQAEAAAKAAPVVQMPVAEMIAQANAAGRESAERYAASVDWSTVTPAIAWDCPAAMPASPANLLPDDRLAWEMACDIAANDRWRELCVEHGITPDPRASGWAALAQAEESAYRRGVARRMAARAGA